MSGLETNLKNTRPRPGITRPRPRPRPQAKARDRDRDPENWSRNLYHWCAGKNVSHLLRSIYIMDGLRIKQTEQQQTP